jgi:hypothetical protein
MFYLTEDIMENVCVVVHSGHLSLDNGAVGPLTYYFDLGKIEGIEARPGHCYGDDRLEVSHEDWPTVKELLDENCMLYRVEGLQDTWQNVKTDEVTRRLQFSAC